MFVSRGLGGRACVNASSNAIRKNPFTKGIVFMVLAALSLICGTVMTILEQQNERTTTGYELLHEKKSIMTLQGFSDVFGAGVTMFGMLTMAASVLMFLFAIRQFLISKKMRTAEQTLQISRGTVAAMVIEREDDRGTLTVVMDTINIETRCNRSRSSEDLPPDYTEATMSEVVEETTEGGEPPPPYGPPAYDEIAAGSDDTQADDRGDIGKEEQKEMLNQHELMHQPDLGNDRLSAADVDVENQRQEQITIGAYQDLPMVTI